MTQNTDIKLQKQITAELYAANTACGKGEKSFPKLPFCHIICVKSGEMTVKNADNLSQITASGGSVIIIPQGDAHILYFGESCEYIGIFVSFSVYDGFDLLSFYDIPDVISNKKKIFSISEKLCETVNENLFTFAHIENAVMIKSLLYELLSEILSCGSIPTKKIELLERFAVFSDILGYMNFNITSALPQETLARMANTSVDIFYKTFRAYFNTAPKDYIITQRLQKAARELFMTKRPINEISRAVGYENNLYFSTLFRKKYGLCPTEYRKILANLY